MIFKFYYLYCVKIQSQIPQSITIMKSAAFLLALAFCHNLPICNGQQITQQTTVTVLNEDGSPAVNAIAFRLSKTDLAIRQTVMADSAGRIVFPGNVDFGKEFVKITAFGYKDIDITDGSPSEPLKVVFAPLSVRLDEFVVSVEQNTVQKSDRLVFNIAGTNLAKGNNIYEVLKFAPLVKEENRQLSIIGKESTLLYVNGRKTNVPAESMNAYLRGIPAENIAKIEVITNPGATLRDSGNTGIINIELKKNENDGVKGSLYVEDVQRKNNSQYGSLYLDMQKKNLNVTAGLYVNHSIQDAVNDTDYDYFNSGDKERLHENNNTRSLMTGGNVRADYRINPNHTIGMGFDAFHTEGKNRTLSDIYYGKLNSPSIDSVYYSDNRTDAPVSRYAVNLNYRGKISENDWLTIDLDYLRNERDNTVFNSYFLHSAEEQVLRSRFEQSGTDALNSYSGKIEYRHDFNAKHSLTAGFEGTRTDSESDFYHTSVVDDQYIPDTGKNNFFSYRETYIAGFLSYGWRINDKWSGIVGARLENVDARGNQKATGDKITRHDLNLIPSLSVMFAPNANHRLSYNLFSIAARPGYYSLNPSVFWLNPTTYKEFNPDLKTARMYSNGLTYTLKGAYTFLFSYMYVADCTNNFQIPVDGKYTKLKNLNYGDLHSFSLGFNWNKSLLNDYWYVKIAANGNYRRDKGHAESLVIDNSDFYYDASIFSNIVLSKKSNWSVTVNASYTGKMKLAYMEIDPKVRLSLGVKKIITQDWVINFGVNNLFLNRSTTEQTYDIYRFLTKAKYYSTEAFVNLSYSFGNKKSSGAQHRRNSSQETTLRLKE